MIRCNIAITYSSRVLEIKNNVCFSYYKQFKSLSVSSEVLMRPLLWFLFDSSFRYCSAHDQDTQYRGGTMTDLVTVKQNFRKIIREWL